MHLIIGLSYAQIFEFANHVAGKVRVAGIVFKHGDGAAGFGAEAYGHELDFVYRFQACRVADAAEYFFDNGIALRSWSFHLGIIAAAGKTGKRQQEYGYESQEIFGELHRFHGWLVWRF